MRLKQIIPPPIQTAAEQKTEADFSRLAERPDNYGKNESMPKTKTVCTSPPPPFKGAVSPIFSVTVPKSQKTHVYGWKSKSNGSVLLKWLLDRHKRVWLRIARIEMDSNLKTSVRFFQDFVLVSQIKSVRTDLASWFVSLVV